MQRFAATMLTALAVAVLAYLISGTLHGSSSWSRPQDAIATASLVGLAVLGYVGWPSRWNVPAHLMLGFALTAYVIPTCIGDGYSGFPTDVLDNYDAVLGVGFLCAGLGAAIGGEWRLTSEQAVRRRVASISTAIIARRMLVAIVAAVILLIVSFLVMGFVPAFASDPLNAKFFRGIYAERYEPVAPLYRASTSTLILLLPVVTMYAVWRRRPYWLALLPVTVALLLCTLQRGSAVAGILLFVGVALALLQRPLWVRLFAAGLVVVYGFGSISYFLLAALGLGDFAPSTVNTSDITAFIAAGAPDVSDQVRFLGAWLSHPQYTYGATVWGGLLPNHFEWNPAVWTLHVTNPGGSLNEITSGGLRVPAPLWGLVSFGWPGVVAFSIGTGLVFGIASRFMRIAATDPDREKVVLAFLLYSSVLDVIGEFYTLSYMGVFQLLLLSLLFWRRRQRESGRHRPSRARSHAARSFPGSSRGVSRTARHTT